MDGAPSASGRHGSDPWPRLLLDSYERRVGSPLVPRTGDDALDTAALAAAPRIVLCHDDAADPVFVYANDAAASLWRLPRQELVGMASRRSAGPDARAGRAEMLEAARRQGVLRGYHGVRRASDGTLFEILDAIIWTVDGPDGRPVGQAATFDRWRPAAHETPTANHHR